LPKVFAETVFDLSWDPQLETNFEPRMDANEREFSGSGGKRALVSKVVDFGSIIHLLKSASPSG